MKPKYNLFKNFSYALEGLACILKEETSFKIESICFIVAICFLYMIDISILHKIILLLSTLFVLLIECINTSIERCVDLVTKEFHPLAKKAKDIAATAVFISIIMAIISWSTIIYIDYIQSNT